MFLSYFSPNMETSDLSISLCNSMLLMVGSEDEINMKRTEMDIYDYLYNEMLYVPMHRITTGSTKEGLRLLSSRCGYILLIIKSPWGLGLHWCKNVRLNYWEGFSYGILRIPSWNGLSTFDEHASIKWCFM